MLKEVQFSTGSRRNNIPGKAKYVVIGRSCIFSRVSAPAAEESAIQAIVDVEGFDPTQITFFELRTNPQISIFPGSAYDFFQLSLEFRSDGLHVVQRKDTACTPDILQEFGLTRLGID